MKNLRQVKEITLTRLKNNLKMKLSVLFLAIVIFQAHANTSYGQKTKISLDLTNVPIEVVLNEIQKQSKFRFLVNVSEVNLNNNVSVYANKETIKKILTNLFKNREISFEVIKRQIILTTKQQVDGASDSSNIFQQTITGNLTDINRGPLAGVNILVQGTNRGAQTDFDGNYKISASKGEVLVFSFLGMKTQSITVGDSTTLNIVMVEDTANLDEVVVIGYGTTKKSTLAASVSKIDAEAFEALPITNAAQALQGTLPGTVVTRSNGQPGGGGFDLTIRGFSSTNGGNSPLIIIDGIPGALTDLNPSDIDNIVTLKDASAAIYGNRASNGVLLVTTKKGKSGQPIIEIDVSTTFSKPVGFFTSLSAAQTAELAKEGYYTFSDGPTAHPWLPESFLDAAIAGQVVSHRQGSFFLYSDTTDYTDLVFDTGHQQNYNISLSGSTNKSSYRTSLGYIKEEGTLSEGADNNTRFNARLNYIHNFNDRLKIATRMGFVREHTESPVANGFGFVPFTWPFFRNHPDGRPDLLASNQGFTNPLQQLRDHGNNDNFSTDLSVNLKVDYEIVDNVTLTGQVGGDYGFLERSQFIRTYQNYDVETGEPYQTRNSPNRGTKFFDKSLYSTVIGYANYANVFNGVHDVSITAGASQEQGDNEGFWARRTTFPSNDFFSLNLGDGDSQENNGSATDWSLESVFGRAAYIYDGKYIVSGQFRYDGSSRFSGGDQWGFFWGASLAWNLHKENFIQDLNIFDNLKLRISTGETGNQQGIGLYDFQQRINVGGQYPFGNGGRVSGAFLGNLVDPTRSWETIETKNIGLDFTLFDNKLSGSFDYFIKTNKDMLAPVTAPQVLGAQPPFSNSGELEGKGFELSLAWRDKISDDLSYFVSGTLFDSKNKVTKYIGQDTYNSGVVGIREGYPINDIYGYTFDGIIQDQVELDAYKTSINAGTAFTPTDIQIGDAKYKDLNGDGRLSTFGDDGTNGDVTPIGNVTPRYSYGFNLGIEYKNFEVSVFFQGVGERDFFIGDELRRPWSVPWRRPDARFYNNTWLPTRPNAKFPRAVANNGIGNYNYVLSTNTLLDGSYLRLKNVRISYNLPKEILNKVGIQRAKFYLTGFDLWTVTKLDGGYDPESVSNSNYPFSKRFTLGLNLAF